MDADEITVLIPAFNRRAFIGEAIQSILDQTYGAIKILVYDDGSTDNTAEIASQFANVELIRGTKNQGVSFARNTLMDQCTTRYAAWQDSDDISNIHRIASQIEFMKQSDAALVFCNWDYFTSKPRSNVNEMPNPDPNNSSRAMGGSMIDLEKINGIQFINEITLGGEDFVWFEMIRKKFGNPGLLHKKLYYVRKHGQRISSLKFNSLYQQKRKLSDQAYHTAMNQLNSIKE